MELLKLVIIHIMQRYSSDILRCVAVCNICYYGSSYRLLMIQRQMTLKANITWPTKHS